MILHVYFARRFFSGFLMLLFVLFSLIALVDLIDLLRDFGDLGVNFAQIVQLVFLKSPTMLNQILPLVVLLATIVLFLNLARTSELVVTRAAGRSALRALVAPVAATLAIGIVAVTVLGPLVAASSNRFTQLSESYEAGGAAVLSVSADGLWLRQGSPTGQTVIRASRSNADGSILYDVTFLEYAQDGQPVRRIEASEAQLRDGNWVLKNAKSWLLASNINAEASAERFDLLRLPSSLTLDRIRDSLGTASGVSIWDMRMFIGQLEEAGFSARRHHVWLQAELARPLFLIAMVLVGAGLTMRHTRLGGTGPAVLTAVMLGFALYFIRSFAIILGENGQLNVLLATWAVPVAANMLALGLILHMEDG